MRTSHNWGLTSSWSDGRQGHSAHGSSGGGNSKLTLINQ